MFPVHALIDVLGKLENGNSKGASGICKRRPKSAVGAGYTWPPQAYSCAQREGAKFCTLTERLTLHRLDPLQKALEHVLHKRTPA